jgi:hypothetical protein
LRTARPLKEPADVRQLDGQRRLLDAVLGLGREFVAGILVEHLLIARPCRLPVVGGHEVVTASDERRGRGTRNDVGRPVRCVIARLSLAEPVGDRDGVTGILGGQAAEKPVQDHVDHLLVAGHLRQD